MTLKLNWNWNKLFIRCAIHNYNVFKFQDNISIMYSAKSSTCRLYLNDIGNLPFTVLKK